MTYRTISVKLSVNATTVTRFAYECQRLSSGSSTILAILSVTDLFFTHKTISTN